MTDQSQFQRKQKDKLPPWCWLALGLVILCGFSLVQAAKIDLRHLQFAWLSSFLFFTTLSLGLLFLTMIHHLFDCSWSSPLRRLFEGCFQPAFFALAILFLTLIPLKPSLYSWLDQRDRAPIISLSHFTILSLICIALWNWVSNRLTHWSLKQDKNGMPRCTQALRQWSVIGMFAFAITITIVIRLWIEPLTPKWHSAIYPFWFFSASVWGAVAFIYLLAQYLHKTGGLPITGKVQFHRLGTLLFAFTLFHAYIAVSQYLIVWHTNKPDEISWYLIRDNGAWKNLSCGLILGHFAIPFLLLLRTQWKLMPGVMIPLCIWICVMHYADILYQVMPSAYPGGVLPGHMWIDVSCVAFMGGFIGWFILRFFSRHPLYCLRDPRMSEAMGSHIPPTTTIATAPEQANEN